MKASEVLNILGITRVTLCNYVKKGYIKATKMRNSTYNYDDKSVYAFIGLKKRKA